MGCLCRLAVDALVADATAMQGSDYAGPSSVGQTSSGGYVSSGGTAGASSSVVPGGGTSTVSSAAQQPTTTNNQVVDQAAAWLAARWLPAPPFQPDPDWLDLDLPPPPLPAPALAVVCALVQAGQQARNVLGIDLADPTAQRSLARTVATLNRRTQALAQLAQDDQPWAAVAARNAQADQVIAASEAGVFTKSGYYGAPAATSPTTTSGSVTEAAARDTPIAPWRNFVSKIKALAPLVAIGQMLNLDLADPEAMNAIAGQLRSLRSVELPKLQDAQSVSQVITRNAAVAMLQQSFGRDPRQVPFSQVANAVQRKTDRAAALVPVDAQGQPDMPPRQPNPSQLVNAAVVQVASRITTQQLNWKVPPYAEVPLLASGVPAMALIGALGQDVVRKTPCDRSCDANAALSSLPAGA